jgi:hypothetical protein
MVTVNQCKGKCPAQSGIAAVILELHSLNKRL